MDNKVNNHTTNQYAFFWNYFEHVDHVTNNFGPQPAEENQTEEIFVPADLKFFDSKLFGGEKGQRHLIDILKSAASLIDTNSGADWFCVYAAYRYYKNQLGTQKEYVGFFTDIEHLLPGMLVNIVESEQGDKRYHSYTQMLSREVQKWYVRNKSLPPLNDLSYGVWFNGTREQFDSYSLIIRQLYVKFRKADAELRANKAE